MCRLKKHAYAELPPSKKLASQGKNVRTNMRNSAFPRALMIHKFVVSLRNQINVDILLADNLHEMSSLFLPKLKVLQNLSPQ